MPVPTKGTGNYAAFEKINTGHVFHVLRVDLKKEASYFFLKTGVNRVESTRGIQRERHCR